MQRSIQRAAVCVLDHYYSDFPVFNPALLNLPKSILTKKMSAFKVYNLGEGDSFFSSLQKFVSVQLKEMVLNKSRIGSDIKP